MNRFYKLIFTGVLFIIFTSFFWIFQTGVTISMDAPDTIEAGTEVTVNVTINKGRVSGHARYQQELPAGFTARSDNSAHAIFSFQDQKVTLMWVGLPSQDEIKFSYKIIADERLTGSIDLDGTFGYIDNNDRHYANVRPKMVAINPSPNVSPEMRVDVNDFAIRASMAAAAVESGQTVAFRQQPVWMEEDRVYLVTLLINKDAARKYAKIEETVPAGFTATNLDSKGGIFTFRNQVASIIWMDLPLEPYFTVTYILIPQDGAVAASAINISGLFTFIISERTFESAIIERSETLASLDREQLNRILSGATIHSSEQRPLTADSQTSAPSTPTTVTPSTSTTVTPSTPTTVPPSTPTTVLPSRSYILSPEEGIYYRVQIAAGHRPVNVPQYFRNYRLQYDVMREDHEGWFKYTVGSFAEYKDARDYRVHTSNTTTINDAFVVAYNDGRRITVQDALMALNQQWIR